MTATLLNSKQAAAFLGIHPKTLQKWARNQQVPAIRMGGLWRFVASELDRWLNGTVSSNPPLVS
jgi:excisionase family DNA binding protein